MRKKQRLLWAILLSVCCSVHLSAQEYLGRIAFYNVENLFDTIPGSGAGDEEYTPQSRLQWSSARYDAKLQAIARVIDSLGQPLLMGLAEIENRQVLEDLCAKIRTASYGIVHHDSPDGRGIDVALLYRKDSFTPVTSQQLPVTVDVDGVATPSRDILYTAMLSLKTGDTLHVYVNHWPSRRGGVAASAPRRRAAADILTAHLGGLLARSPESACLLMGDFNDEPSDPSIREGLLNFRPGLLVNKADSLHAAGRGSYNYRGTWNMLDQVLVSRSLTDGRGLDAGKFDVYQPDFLSYKHERFGRMPNRTYGGPNYYGGTSDHYPVFLDVWLYR